MNNMNNMMQKESKSIKLLRIVTETRKLNYRKVCYVLLNLYKNLSNKLSENEEFILLTLIDAFLFIVKNNKNDKKLWVLPRYLPYCTSTLFYKIVPFLIDSVELLYFKRFVRVVVEITKKTNECEK